MEVLGESGQSASSSKDSPTVQGDQIRAEPPMSGGFEGPLAEKITVGRWAESRAVLKCQKKTKIRAEFPPKTGIIGRFLFKIFSTGEKTGGFCRFLGRADSFEKPPNLGGNSQQISGHSGQ